MSKKVVILDGHTIDCEGLHSWNRVNQLVSKYDSQLYINRHTTEENLLEQAQGANILVVSGSRITADILKSLSSTLDHIITASTGHERIDVETANKLGISVSNIPDYGTENVATFTFQLLLNALSPDGMNSSALMSAGFIVAAREIARTHSSPELSDRTVGIVGLGRIGAAVLRRLQPFGIRTLVNTRTQKSIEGLDYELCSLEELLPQSDAVLLHCDLNPTTHNIMNASTLALMKQNSLLINTSRGELIDERALFDALLLKKPGAAVLDVMADETTYNSNLRQLTNVAITPHIASMVAQAGGKLFTKMVDTLDGCLRGEPKNVIAAPPPRYQDGLSTTAAHVNKHGSLNCCATA